MSSTNRGIPIIVLAGGYGTRLGPLTENIPKPMVEVNGRPFIGYLIDELERQGFEEFVFSTGYKGHILEDYLQYEHKFHGDSSYHIRRDEKMKGSLSAIIELFRSLEIAEAYVINGDTYPLYGIPDMQKLGIKVVHRDGVDAGIYFYKSTDFLEKDNSKFIDMGTFEGLKAFERHVDDNHKKPA